MVLVPASIAALKLLGRVTPPKMSEDSVWANIQQCEATNDVSMQAEDSLSGYKRTRAEIVEKRAYIRRPANGGRPLSTEPVLGKMFKSLYSHAAFGTMGINFIAVALR